MWTGPSPAHPPVRGLPARTPARAPARPAPPHPYRRCTPHSRRTAGARTGPPHPCRDPGDRRRHGRPARPRRGYGPRRLADLVRPVRPAWAAGDVRTHPRRRRCDPAGGLDAADDGRRPGRRAGRLVREPALDGRPGRAGPASCGQGGDSPRGRGRPGAEQGQEPPSGRPGRPAVRGVRPRPGAARHGRPRAARRRGAPADRDGEKPAGHGLVAGRQRRRCCDGPAVASRGGGARCAPDLDDRPQAGTPGAGHRVW